MTSGGNNFNDFHEIVPTREITSKIEKTFLVFSSVAVGLFLEWAQCYSINSTQLSPALVVGDKQNAWWEGFVVLSWYLTKLRPCGAYLATHRSMAVCWRSYTCITTTIQVCRHLPLPDEAASVWRILGYTQVNGGLQTSGWSRSALSVSCLN